MDVEQPDRIPILRPFVPPGIEKDLATVLESGWIAEGPRVEEFERALGRFIGHPHVVCLNSCTSAIHLALHLLNLGRGDEVITTPFTCAATNLPLVHRSVTPVWADVDPSTGLIAVDSCAELITDRTRAILCVDLHGNPCDYERINALARQHGIAVIADAAQSFGGRYRGRRVGCLGEFTCLSFQAVKAVTTVEGGAICVGSPELFDRARRLRWFGIDRQAVHRSPTPWIYDIEEAGYKFHMNDVAACVGIRQMEFIDGLLAHQRDNAKYYDAELSGLPGIRPVPAQRESEPSYWLYALLVDERQAFIELMRSRGIEATPFHASNLELSIFRDGRPPPDLPGLRELERRVVCIPNGYWVGQGERERIVTAARDFASRSLQASE